MRITFLCPHLGIAGGVRAILSYAHRLAGRGHEVTVVVKARHTLDAWWRNRRPRAPGWWPDFGAGIRWVGQFRPDQLPPGDAVVATAWYTAPVAAAAPARCGIGCYLIQHYESLYHGPPTEVDATYRLPLRRIVISTWLREVLRDRFGVEAEVLVTPVDPGLFHHCPSWDEGLGMPAMEAMACGAALVTYDNGGCRDYAHHGVTALVARRRDVGDLADQLYRLVTDHELRRELAQAGRRWVTTAFCWDRAVERMEALLGGTA